MNRNTENGNMLNCPVCGEDVAVNEKYCSRCGSLMQVNAASVELAVDKKPESEKGFVKVVPGKKLPLVMLLYFIIALILGGAVIIYSSGIMDNPSSDTGSQVQSQSSGNNPHAGVDLNSLNEIAQLEKDVDANPSDKENLLKLAHLLNDSGFKAKAADRYNQYLKMDPKNADVLVDLGVCYYETDRGKEAIASMEKAVKFNPRHQIANLNLGIVNNSMGNTAKAVEYWKKAIEIDPNNEIGKKAQELIKQH